MLAAALATFLSLPAGLPPGLQIDGDLAEWSSRPPTIEQFHQVAGARRVAGAGDFSARVWIAFTREGLALAGEVRDDHVLFPEGEKDRLTADHVELWLAFPEMKIPTATFEPCIPPRWTGEDSLADCQAWMNDQASYVTFLRRLFVRQYSFSPLSVAEHFQSPPLKSYGLEFDVKPLPAEARTVFRQTAEGYTFEAFLPSSALPASARTPVTSFSLLVDFVDNDEGRVKQESFLSSAPRRRFGDRSTFQTVKLAEPVLYESRVPLAARRLAGHQDRFFFPAADVDAVYAIADPGPGHWSWPLRRRSHQPILVPLRLTGQALASWNGFSLELVPDRVELLEEEVVLDYELLTVHDGRVAASKGFASYCQGDEGALILKTATWERPPGLHAALFCVGPQNRVGHGTCGSCPVTEAVVVSMDAAGKIGWLYSHAAGTGNGSPVALLDGGLAGTTFPANRDRLDTIDPEDSGRGLRWPDEEPAKMTFPQRFDFGFFYWDGVSRAWVAGFVTWSPGKRKYITVHQKAPGARP